MNKTWLAVGSVIGIVVIVLLVWLIAGSKMNCHESFWDKDKQIIEIKR
jgi:hypothetical protein